jgi:hypothetical protein
MGGESAVLPVYLGRSGQETSVEALASNPGVYGLYNAALRGKGSGKWIPTDRLHCLCPGKKRRLVDND